MRKISVFTAVITCMVMLVLGVKSANADAILFPYFSSGGGDLTFIQVINTKAPTVFSTDTLILQPDGNAGKDSQVRSAIPIGNYAYSPQLTVSASHGMIEFDISAIPAGATINSATFEVLEFGNCSSNQNAIEVHANLGSWNEFNVSWNNSPSYGPSLGTNSGETSGCDWLIFNVAGIVQDWVDGTSTNYGFRITGPSNSNVTKYTRSSDFGSASLRPILRIAYSVGSASESETLHYTYVYNTDTETCQHYDDVGDTSENDILLYEVTDALAPANSGQLLPGDTTSTSPALTVSPAWGYLVVDNANFGTEYDEGTIQGQQINVNTDNMTAYILNAINDPDEPGEENCNYCHSFNSNSDNEHTLSFQPIDYADTVWYLFPVDGDDLTDPAPNEYGIDNCTTLDECYVEIGNDDGGIYDQNESLKSGTPRVYPGCIYEDEARYATSGIPGWQSNDFFFALDEMLTGAQYNAVKNTGGWFDILWSGKGGGGYPYKIVTSDMFGSPLTGMVFEPGHDNDKYSYTK